MIAGEDLKIGDLIMVKNGKAYRYVSGKTYEWTNPISKTDLCSRFMPALGFNITLSNKDKS